MTVSRVSMKVGPPFLLSFPFFLTSRSFLPSPVAHFSLCQPLISGLPVPYFSLCQSLISGLPVTHFLT